MRTLDEIYEDYKTEGFSNGYGDKGTDHTYIEIYSKILDPYRKNSTFMEIGIAYGNSIEMWNEYFIDSTVIGVDYKTDELRPDIMNNPLYNIIISDATKDEFLNSVSQYKFDVIIDDASHRFEDQIKTFEMLKSKMNIGGLYIVEDVSDINNKSNIFRQLHSNCEIIDNRNIKGRFDDVLILYRF